MLCYGLRMENRPFPRDAVGLMTGHTDSRLESKNLVGGRASALAASDAERETVGRVYEFGLVLRAAGLMPADEGEYFERPWKWQPEYESWLGAGMPWPGEADGSLADMRWDRFVINASQQQSTT